MDPFYLPPSGRSGETLIATCGYQGLGVPLAGMRLGVANVAWPSANVGIFVPVTVPEPMTITKMWWVNQNVAACNLDIGIFLEDGTLVISSGTTAMSGGNACQVVDITDTRIARGRYYVGLTCDTVGAAPVSYTHLTLPTNREV